MGNEILKFCMEKGLLLDKDTLNVLGDFDDATAKNIVEKIAGLKERVITKSFITKNADRIQELINDEKVVDKLKISLGLTLEISREVKVGDKLASKQEVKESIEGTKEKGKEFDLGHLKVLYSLINVTKKIEPVDFTRHLRSRYSALKQILQERKELEGLSSINKINGKKQSISVIGAVYSKRITKNKNLILEVEDLSGEVKVLINKDKGELYDRAKGILVDDIIGIRGFGNREIIFVNEIIYPDAHLSEKVHLDTDDRVVFISDIHLGSSKFFAKSFEKFIKWINGGIGNERQKQDAKKVKYILITGDSVDGVGVFPDQQEELKIKDVKDQYKQLAEYLSMIRKDIKIIICPGQHDAVRIAEPQPMIEKQYAQPLYDLENVLLVSNPAMIEIGDGAGKGLKILMYHGASMSFFVNEIESLRIGKAHDNPAKVVREMLKRRHLAPAHSFVTYLPTDQQDPLLISEVPDIINTADFHRTEIDVYNNILIICNSCWQGLTPFMEKMGNHPDFCKVPVLNMKTREIKIMDFSEGK